jgi:hypothetical protein
MKHYVSKEVAIKLKEIGFNEYCKKAIITDIVEREGVEPDELGYEANEIFIDYDLFCNSDFQSVTTIPEMYEVQDWFRNKGIEIEPHYHPSFKLYTVGQYYKGDYLFNNKQTFSTYYKALESGINKAIEIYENIRGN